MTIYTFPSGVNVNATTHLNANFSSVIDNEWKPMYSTTVNTTSTGRSIIAVSSTRWLDICGTNSSKTTNAGSTWSTLTTNPVSGAENVVLCRADKTKGLAWKYTDTLPPKYSTDSGENWTAATAFATSMTSVDSVDFPTTGVAVLSGNPNVAARSIWYSTNGGSTWTLCTTGPTVRVSAISMYDGSTGYALDINRNIWKTTDGGINWTDTGHDTSSTTVDINAPGDGKLFAISSTVVLILDSIDGYLDYYTNSGNSTNIMCVCNNNVTGSSSNIIKATNGYIYFAISESDSNTAKVGVVRLWRSKDSGLTWQAKVIPLTGNWVGAMESGYGKLSEYDTNKLLLSSGRAQFTLIDESLA